MTTGSRRVTWTRFRQGIASRMFLLALTTAVGLGPGVPCVVGAAEQPPTVETHFHRHWVGRSPSGQALGEIAQVATDGPEESRIDLLVKSPAQHHLLITETTTCLLGQALFTTRLRDQESGWWLESQGTVDLGCSSLLDLTVDSIVRAKEEGRAMETRVRTSDGGFGSVKDSELSGKEGPQYLDLALKHALGSATLAPSLLEELDFVVDCACRLARRELGEGQCRVVEALARVVKSREEASRRSGYHEIDWQISLAPLEKEPRPSSPIALLIKEFSGVRWDGKRLTDD